MSVYSPSSRKLETVYDINGKSLPLAYDLTGRIVFPDA